MRSRKRGSPDYQFAVGNLKRILRLEKITYNDLAKGLGMSESGIKKILGGKDASFGRFSEICDFVGVSISELLNDKDRAMTEVGFNLQQQDYFLKNPQSFKLYWKLVYERRSLKELQTSMRLTSSESFKKLRQLDTLGLLKLMPGDKLRLPKVKQIKWTGDGPFVRKIYLDWSKRIVEAVASPKNEPGKLFILRYLKMKTQTYENFIQDHKNLEKEYLSRAVQEMRTESTGLKDMIWLTGATMEGFFVDEK